MVESTDFTSALPILKIVAKSHAVTTRYWFAGSSVDKFATIPIASPRLKVPAELSIALLHFCRTLANALIPCA
jgi:hypothetical protein